MRIIQFITRMDVIGGAQNHVASLILQLKKDGHDVILITGSYNDKLWSFHKENIIVKQIPSLQRNISILHDVKTFFVLRKLLKEMKPDLVAIHSSKAGALGRLAACTLRLKTIFTAHGWSFTEGVSPLKRAIYKRMETFLSRLTSKVIAVSEYDRLLALKEKVLKPNKIVTIHNGIPEQEEPSPLTQIQVDIPQIIMVARFEAPKRQDLLIEALHQLKALQWNAVFVGEGSNRSYVEWQVSEYQLTNRVQFLPSTANVKTLLSNSQIFVLLSNFEGLPISIIEGMRAGLPVIASDVGGVNELVEDCQNGYLIQNHDIKQLTNALQELIINQDLAKQMGDCGNRKYLDFTFQTMYHNTLKEYQLVEQSCKKGIQTHANV